MDEFIGAYKDTFRRYAQFNGRTTRVGFWGFVIFNFVVIWVTYLLAALLNDTLSTFVAGLTGLYSVIVLIPSIAVTVRRLHDTDRSGWWTLLWLFPIANIVLLVLCAFAGTQGPNRYGPQPVGVYSTDSV